MTPLTPSTCDTASVTRLVISSRIGQPLTVSHTSTATAPSSAISTDLIMLSSVRGAGSLDRAR